MSPRKKARSAKAAPKKAASKKRAVNTGSAGHPSGLWIDPDIWRRVKGPGGRRGVEGLPSTDRFLHFADIALGNKTSKSKGPKKQGNEDDLL